MRRLLGLVIGAGAVLRQLGPVLFALAILLPPRAAIAAPSRVVLVLADTAQAGENVEAHLFEALGGQLHELGVDVSVVHGAEEPLLSKARHAASLAVAEHARGVIWLEVRASTTQVFLYDSSGHLYSRDVEATGSLISQSESIALIVGSAVAAMLDGDAVSMTEVSLPAPAAALPRAKAGPDPPRPLVPPQGSYLRVGASYVGSIFAKRTAWQHGAAIAVTAGRVGSPWFLGLDYVYFPALKLEANGAATRLLRHPAEAYVGVQFALGELSLSLQGGVSADYLVRRTQSVDDGLVATPAHERWLWAVSTRLGATIPVSGRVSGLLGLGADFLLNPFELVVADTKSGNVVVGQPMLVRPRLDIGVGVAIW